jgi:hypothetical protein
MFFVIFNCLNIFPAKQLLSSGTSCFQRDIIFPAKLVSSCAGHSSTAKLNTHIKLIKPVELTDDNELKLSEEEDLGLGVTG